MSGRVSCGVVRVICTSPTTSSFSLGSTENRYASAGGAGPADIASLGEEGASAGWEAVPSDEPDAWADDAAPAGVDPAVAA